MNIEEGNKLIDKWFSERVLMPSGDTVGILRGSSPKYYNYYNILKVSDLKYHSSWDWLMPVVEKIHQLKTWRDDKKDLSMFSKLSFDISWDGYYNNCSASVLGSITFCNNDNIPHTYTEVECPSIFVHDKPTAIKAAYEVIIKFLEWYNKLNKEPDVQGSETTMLNKEQTPECTEKNCNEPSIGDYNGHGAFACEYHMKKEIRDYLHLYIGCKVKTPDTIGVNLGLFYPQVWADEGKVEPNGVNVYYPDHQTIYVQNINQVKLILRRLSDITEDERWEIYTIGHMRYKGGIFEMLRDKLFDAAQFKRLLKMGVDLFGLIESGLAIDATTINNPLLS